MTGNIAVEKNKSHQGLGQDKETKTLIEAAYSRIKQMIFQQELIPRQRLIYRDLSNILNMSRTPIINALNRLEQEGFVVSESFRGFYVKPIDIQEAWDLFGIREALEVYAIDQAIYHAEPGDIEILTEKLRNHEQYMPDRYDKKKAVLDAGFHLQIAAMSSNRVLVDMLKINLEHIYLRYVWDAIDTRRMPFAVQEHYKLVEKIKQKDVLGGIETMRLHVRKAREVIIAGISMENQPVHIL
jgi:DNA-binding GntR family transcriptional regulator